MPKEYARKERIGTQLQQELASLIRDGLRDPRVVGVTVTEVDAAPDMRNATVKVSLLGSDAQLAEAIKGLNRAAGKLRHDLGERLQMRHLPQLRFVADRGMRDGDRVNGIIQQAVAADMQAAKQRN